MITEQHIQELYPKLLGQALLLTYNMDDAEDLVQEVMYRIWKGRASFDNDKLGAWSYTICKNTFINKYRKDIRRPIHSGRAIENYPLFECTSSDSTILCEELKGMIKELPKKEQIIEDRIVGYSYKELAERYQLPLGTIKSRIHFARKNIAQKLAVA